ncbi:MAG: hypothetical protein AAGH15_09185 [Myxococcota bacterium]
MATPDAEQPDFGGADAGRPDAGQPDLPTTCTGGCDPVSFARCDEGTTCLLQDELPLCYREVGMGTVGEPCELDPDDMDRMAPCEAGLACFRVGTEGVCARVCCPVDADDEACGLDEECGGSGRLADGSLTNFGFCRPPTNGCELLAPDGCGPGEACYPTGSEGDTRCHRSGVVDLGAACRVPEQCAPGLTCAGFFEPRCVRVCRLEGSACPAGSECLRFPQSPPGTGLCT